MEIDRYEQRLRELREENQLLREAALTFGDLAQRLASELRAVKASEDRARPPTGQSGRSSA